MRIAKFHLYLADLNPHRGTEPGNARPVAVVQTDLLNNIHPSTIVCPITSHVIREAQFLRVHLSAGRPTGLRETSDILVDQIRAIDNRRFKKEIGHLSKRQREHLLENLKILVLE